MPSSWSPYCCSCWSGSQEPAVGRTRTPSAPGTRTHERAKNRPAARAAAKGERYTLVVQETQYGRVPPEVRGTINGLQTFVRDVPDPSGSDALREGDSIRVQVTDHGTGGTSAQARFLERT